MMDKYSPIFQRVRCISIRESNPDQLKLYHDYFLDLNSVYMDFEGCAFGNIYDAFSEEPEWSKDNFIGTLLLSHFRSVERM